MRFLHFSGSHCGSCLLTWWVTWRIWFMSRIMWPGGKHPLWCDISGSQTDCLLHWLQVHHRCPDRGGGSRWGWFRVKIAHFCKKKQLLLFPLSDILLKAREGRQQRGENTPVSPFQGLFFTELPTNRGPLSLLNFLLRFPEDQMLREGYPAYTTSCAWLGYSDELFTQVAERKHLRRDLNHHQM